MSEIESPPLTPREKEILGHITLGKSGHEIAEAMGLSFKTVEWHRTNLMRKLGVHKVANLVRYALEYGLVDQRH